jgi:hypothetical protein
MLLDNFNVPSLCGHAVDFQLEYLQDSAPTQLMTDTSTLTSVDSQLIGHQDATPAQVMADASTRMLETYAEFVGPVNLMPTAAALPSRRHAAVA